MRDWIRSTGIYFICGILMVIYEMNEEGTLDG